MEEIKHLAHHQETGIQKFPSLEDLQNQLSKATIVSTKQAIIAGFPSLGALKRESSEDKVRAFLIYNISEYIQFLNVGKSMNASQIIETAGFILQYYNYLTMADIKLFFDRMKMGRYGKTYDRIDGQVILEKIELYNQERMQEYEALRMAQHNEEKKMDVVSQLHPSIIEAIKNAIPPKAREHKPIEKKELTEIEKFYQRAYRQFNNLYSVFGIPGTLRRIKVGDKIFTIEAFFEYKFQNFKK